MIVKAVQLQPKQISLFIREEEFCSAVAGCAPGRRIEYHRGDLPIDRARGLSPLGEKARRELNAIADRARALAEDGRLILIQQRHGFGDYTYFAAKPKRILASLNSGGS